MLVVSCSIIFRGKAFIGETLYKEIYEGETELLNSLVSTIPATQ